MRRTFVEETKGELTEAEAIRRAQGGDAAAFEYLYSSRSRHVYNLCLRMVRNTNDAEDLNQQIFLQVFRKIATFRGDSSFSTWLHRSRGLLMVYNSFSSPVLDTAGLFRMCYFPDSTRGGCPHESSEVRNVRLKINGTQPTDPGTTEDLQGSGKSEELPLSFRRD